MMKFVYIALIPILTIFIAIYIVLHLSYRQPVIDKNMTTLTNNLVQNRPTLNLVELTSTGDSLQHPMPKDIWEKNLFDPGRGGAASVSGSGGLKNVELVGVIDSGNFKGAVILIKTGDAGSSSYYGASYGSYGSAIPPSYPPAGGGGASSGGYSAGYGSYGAGGGYGASTPPGYSPPGSQQKQQVPVKQKAVFKVGDRLPNGLILESVGKDFVMLRGGSESVKLKMVFSDDNTGKRVTEASRIMVKPQVTVISGEQGPGAPGYPGTASPTVVTQGGTSSSSPQSQGVFQGYGR